MIRAIKIKKSNGDDVKMSVISVTAAAMTAEEQLRLMEEAGVEPISSNPYAEKSFIDGLPPGARSYMMPEGAQEEELRNTVALNKLVEQASKPDFMVSANSQDVEGRIAALEAMLESNFERLGVALYMKYPGFQPSEKLDNQTAFAQASSGMDRTQLPENNLLFDLNNSGPKT